MLYTVANEGWTPGSPLPTSATIGGLYRTRGEAEAVAAGRRLLAVAVRYDADRAELAATSPADREFPKGWAVPALMGDSGVVMSLASIPAPLVKVVGQTRLRVHPGHADCKFAPAVNRHFPVRSRS